MFDHAIAAGAVIVKAAVDAIKAVRSLAPPAKPDLLPVYRLRTVVRPSNHQAAADVPDTLENRRLSRDRARLRLFIDLAKRRGAPRNIPGDLMFHG